MTRTVVSSRPFSTSPALHLIGGRHRDKGRVVFPLPADLAYEAIALPERGSLWSYTVQRFAPKSPPFRGDEPFTPFAVGYVELPGALIVESRLVDVEFDALWIGMPLQLTLVEFAHGAAGAEQTYAFRPAAAGVSCAPQRQPTHE